MRNGSQHLPDHAVQKRQPGDMQVAKDERFQGMGIDSAVLQRAIDYAKEKSAKKLVILSNTILSSAMHLYKKFGFKQVPITDMQYGRVNIQLEKEL